MKEKDARFCILAHDVINKLGIIAGNCELILIDADKLDRTTEQRLLAIHAMALKAAEQLKERHCPIDVSDEAKAATV